VQSILLPDVLLGLNKEQYSLSVKQNTQTKKAASQYNRLSLKPQWALLVHVYSFEGEFQVFGK